MLLWILRRELARQARYRERPPGGRYEGPLLPILLVVGPVGLLTLLSAPPPVAWRVGLALYALYLACAAARLGAGAVAGDLDALRLLGGSPLEVLGGKLAAALLPLAGELGVWAVFLLTLHGVAAETPGAGAATLVAQVVSVLGCVALAYGLLGMYWSVSCSGVDEAIRRASGWAHGLIWGGPVASLLLALWFASGSLSEVAILPSLFHPWLGLAAVQCRADPDPAWRILAVASGAALVGPVGLLTATLRRLRGRLS